MLRVRLMVSELYLSAKELTVYGNQLQSLDKVYIRLHRLISTTIQTNRKKIKSSEKD